MSFDAKISPNKNEISGTLSLLKGEKGDSAFECWLSQEGNENKTFDDFMNELSIGGDMSNYATKDYVDSRVESADINLEAATTSKLGGVIVGENLQINNNGVLKGASYDFVLNIIPMGENASISVTGEFPNFVVTFNLPFGEITPEKKMWFGYLQYDPTGVNGISSLQEIGANLTMVTIQKGVDAETLLEMTPQTLGKTSTGIAPNSSFLCVIYPKEENYTVTLDNGIGGKIEFGSSTGDYYYNGVEIMEQIDGVIYCVSGVVTRTEGEYFMYVD